MISLNGSQNPSSIRFNGNNVDSVYFNGTKVWPDNTGITLTYKLYTTSWEFKDSFEEWHTMTIDGVTYSSKDSTIEGTINTIREGQQIDFSGFIVKIDTYSNPLTSKVVLNNVTVASGPESQESSTVSYTYTVPSGVTNISIIGTMVYWGTGVQTFASYLSITES